MEIRAAARGDLVEVSASYDHHARSSTTALEDESPGSDRWAAKVGDEPRRGEHLLVVAGERLHRACGFTEAGVPREVGWKFAAWVDTAYWLLRLGEEAPAS